MRRCEKTQFLAPDLCSDCRCVLATARATTDIEWKVWRSELRKGVKNHLKHPSPKACIPVVLHCIDQQLAKVLVQDFAGTCNVHSEYTKAPNRRAFFTAAVTQLQQFGTYCAFEAVDPKRGFQSAWLHSRLDLLIAVTPALIQARTGAQWNWSASVTRDLTLTFHRLVLNTEGTLLFPAGFQWTDKAKVNCTAYVKYCVQELYIRGARLSAAQAEFAN